jgi:hypothetical protein
MNKDPVAHEPANPWVCSESLVNRSGAFQMDSEKQWPRALMALMLATLMTIALGPASQSEVIARAGASLASYNHLAVEKTKKKKFVTAEVAAQRLYQAWHQRNRSAALRVATTEAVNKLFHEKWRPMKPGKNFCQNRGGAITCIYHDVKAGVLEMEVEGGVSVGGYSVTSVSLFSAVD